MIGGGRVREAWSHVRTTFSRGNLAVKWAEARAGRWWNLLLLGLVALLAVPAVLLMKQGITLLRATGPGGIAGTATITTCEPDRSDRGTIDGWNCDARFASADGTIEIDSLRLFPYFPGEERPSGDVPARVASATSNIASTGPTWKWAIPFFGGIGFAGGAAWLFYIIYLEPEPPSRRRARRKLEALQKRARADRAS